MKYSREEVTAAFKIALRNAYTKCYNTDQEMMFYLFMAGMIFQETGKPPKDILNNPEELEEIHKKLHSK